MNNALITAAAAVFVFGMLVSIHELGHFLIAKYMGVRVLEFSLGMGPKIFKLQGRETVYSIGIFPIGGYVKMLGEDGGTSDPRAFCNRSPWKRLPIIAAGPIMNFVLAFVLYILISHNLGFVKPIVSSVVPGAPAQAAGIIPGDKIVGANGNRIKTYDEFLLFMVENQGKEIELRIERDNTYKNFTIKPVKNEKTKLYFIGISCTLVKGEGIKETVINAFTQTFSSIKLMVVQLRSLIAGKVSTDNVGGPVAIVQMSGTAAKQGIWNLLDFAGFLSINLGVMNLIPFPALDGGLIIILLLEGITRKKIDERKVGMINYVGFIALIALIIVVTFQDITRIFL